LIRRIDLPCRGNQLEADTYPGLGALLSPSEFVLRRTLMNCSRKRARLFARASTRGCVLWRGRQWPPPF